MMDMASGENAMRAYILIQTRVGEAGTVAREVAKLDGVTMANDVTGPYDVVVQVESEGLADLNARVLGSIQQVRGITRTLTCPVIEI